MSSSQLRKAKTAAALRVDWVDVAKGLSIVLVVLLHTVNFMAERGMADSWWHGINAAVEPIRMPLFFLVAGLFAASGVALSWKDFWRRRIAPLLYLYLLWMLLRFALFTVFPQISGTNETSSVLNLLTGLVNPSSGLWFLYALMVYAVVARACRSVDPRVQLAAATVLGIVGPAVIAEFSWTWDKIVSYLLFFMIGLHLRAMVLRVGSATTTWAALIWPAGFATVYLVSAHTPSAAFFLLVSLVGLITGVVVCARIQRWRTAVPLRRLGVLTLPIYLLHEIILGTTIFLAGALGVDARLHGAGPILVTVVTVGMSVFVSRALGGRTGLLEVPRAWRAV